MFSAPMLPDLLRLLDFPDPSPGLVGIRSLLSLDPSGTRGGSELPSSKWLPLRLAGMSYFSSEDLTKLRGRGSCFMVSSVGELP